MINNKARISILGIPQENRPFFLKGLARHFEQQGTGGDIILTSTKNVFAPGASFGAYSATVLRLAAHPDYRLHRTGRRWPA